MSLILNLCDKSYFVQILLIVKTFFKIACYLAPVLIIIVSMIQIFKIVISGKDDDLKEALKVTVKRIITGLLIAFLPALTNYVFTLVNASDVNFIACFESASKEKVASLKEKEEKEEEAKKKAQEKEDEILLRKSYENDQAKKAKQKELFAEEQKKREERNNTPPPDSGNLSTDGSNYREKLNNMSTPTISQLQEAASQAGIANDYLKIVIGTTQREGYINDPYLNYGWASAMLNNKVTIEQMQGWDPNHSGESNYYSETNINNGYNNASDDVLKSVYIALTERNTKIIECNGMYSTTPSSYNLLYSSSVYNCSIYETK